MTMAKSQRGNANRRNQASATSQMFQKLDRESNRLINCYEIEKDKID